MTRIAVIGAGAVGCATASALVRAGHDVTLIEAGPDVGAGTSKANTAIWHTGFDAKPGTREAELVARGHRLLTERADAMNWPLERTGALLVAWDDEQLGRLDGIVANAEQVGYHAIERLTVEQVYAAEPHLGEGVRGALRVPDEGLLDPWSITIGLATDAVVNGATLLTSAPVTAVEQRGESYRITAGPHLVDVDWVVNAAGLHSDDVDRLLGEDAFTVTPRRGQLIVFDKLSRTLLRHIILPVPTATTKGVLVSPTVYGNILLGPTAEDLPDKRATETTQSGIDGLLAMGHRILPSLLDEEVTATYSGLRAATEYSDYCLAIMAPKRYVRMGGIRSTGISSCLALAEEVTLQLAEHAVSPAPIADPVTVPMPNLAEARLRPYADAALIARDPAYGHVVCLCERATSGEIRDALAALVPARDVDGIRRRTRALAGRCQGFHCGSTVTAMLEQGGRDA
jgi:glycerol-3-phosphate dehydrogenase